MLNKVRDASSRSSFLASSAVKSQTTPRIRKLNIADRFSWILEMTGIIDAIRRSGWVGGWGSGPMLTPILAWERGGGVQSSEYRVRGWDTATGGWGRLALSGLLWWPIVWGQATGSNSEFAGAAGVAALVFEPDALVARGGAQPVRALVVAARAGGAAGPGAGVSGAGPALAQFFDLPGHVRLLAAAFDRLRRAGRMVAVTIGVTVLAWTVSQTLPYQRRAGPGRPAPADQGAEPRRAGARAGGAGGPDAVARRGRAGGQPAAADAGDGRPVPGLDRALGRPRTSPLALAAPRRRRAGRTLIWGATALYLLYRLVRGSPGRATCRWGAA